MISHNDMVRIQLEVQLHKLYTNPKDTPELAKYRAGIVADVGLAEQLGAILTMPQDFDYISGE